MPLTNLFTDHPRTVGQSYRQHIVPFVFTDSAGDKVRELHRVLEALAAAAR